MNNLEVKQVVLVVEGCRSSRCKPSLWDLQGSKKKPRSQSNWPRWNSCHVANHRIEALEADGLRIGPEMKKKLGFEKRSKTPVTWRKIDHKRAIRKTKETKNTWQSAGNDSFNLELKDKTKAINKNLNLTTKQEARMPKWTYLNLSRLLTSFKVTSTGTASISWNSWQKIWLVSSNNIWVTATQINITGKHLVRCRLTSWAWISFVLGQKKDIVS